MSSPNPLRLTVIDYEAIPNVTPEQAKLAMRRIAERARDADDARLLLDIVLDMQRPGVGRRRDLQNPDWASRVYRYPVPVGPAGKDYRAKVRAWGRAHNKNVLPRAPLEGWLLNAYVEATGDVWQQENGKGAAA